MRFPTAGFPTTRRGTRTGSEPGRSASSPRCGTEVAIPVWTFAGTRPASFWARRMSHETAVHRAGTELAAGLRPAFAPDLAADAIDEWLVSCAARLPKSRTGD